MDGVLEPGQRRPDGMTDRDRQLALGRAAMRLVELLQEDDDLRAGLGALLDLLGVSRRLEASAQAEALLDADEAPVAGPVTARPGASAAEDVAAAVGVAPGAPRHRETDEEIVPIDRAAMIALIDAASQNAAATASAPPPPVEVAAGGALVPAAPIGAREAERDDPDAALPVIVARARLRAVIARDVAERARSGLPVPEEHVHRARSEGASTWVADLAAPDAEAVTAYAECLDALADAADMVVLVGRFHPDDRPRRAQAVRDLAAVQSALRVATSRLRVSSDEEQLAAFEWLRTTTKAERIFVERHMQLSDPLDPDDISEIAFPLQERLQELRARAERADELRRGYQKLGYLARQIGGGKAAPGDAAKLVDVVEALVGLQLAPSSLRFRDVLYPILDRLPVPDDAHAGYGRVWRELDLHRERSMPTAEDDVESEDESDAVLARVRTTAEAVGLARDGLSRVVIPDSAVEHIGDLDAAPEAAAWGRATWRALRALDAYAADAQTSAGFRDWCERSGSPLAWPPGNKRLAMTESETVRNALLPERTFEIDPQVDPSGHIVMLAHCKIGGGGTLVPRIYFHDDTKGRTGRVHVGFIGPHREMPNASTN